MIPDPPASPRASVMRRFIFCVVLNRHDVLVFDGGMFHSNCRRCGQDDDWSFLRRLFRWRQS